MEYMTIKQTTHIAKYDGSVGFVFPCKIVYLSCFVSWDKIED